MQTENYRKRAGDVRRAARANLLSLRQERLSKRAALIDDLAGQRAVLSASHDVDEVAVLDAETGDLSTDTSSWVETAAEVDALDALAMRNAQAPEVAEADLADQQDVTVDQASDLPDEQQSDPNEELLEDGLSMSAEHDDKNDLTLLPGAGPGLIWMLSECGVHTLAELAEQSPQTLTEKLGVVGRIINVERWIAFAADHGESRQS